MIYLQLFWSFLQIGLFSVGGGYAAMPLIQAQTVQLHGWLTMNEFTDLVTIAEMTPGPIAVNSATFVGIRIAGLPGALVATLGASFRPCLSSPCWLLSTIGIKICPFSRVYWPACARQWWLSSPRQVCPS